MTPTGGPQAERRVLGPVGVLPPDGAAAPIAGAVPEEPLLEGLRDAAGDLHAVEADLQARVPRVDDKGNALRRLRGL
eukprot:CAMPEP_0195160608 /NCGR_PEP_ID=MMETSP0448-20130528/186751_1 /TAXON_ID=66468 /ORGANISM="Heterocapsa triquestra, Strain CCMP 448" /LENGTH=76 /DNA_ID=CAMNT_0040199409 /DNA_START=521 /DNA_END=748 /DNA_ORIENTATION=+